jgi:hypothetical protein
VPIEPEALLWAWLREGWKYRLKQGWTGPARRGNEPYLKQMNHEMELILAKGYASYFLLVSWGIRWAKDNEIVVGPGRGSSAASLVCFLLRITEPDPLDFPLTDFSRFVDPTREDLPDIDIDFDDELRHKVREAFVEKFGADRIGNIGTFTKYKGKSALDDVQKVFSLPKGRIEELKGMIVERSGGDSRADAALMDTIEMFEGAAAIYAEFPDIQKAIDLEGNYKGMSTHAAGVVVTTRPISDICAMYTREVKGRKITAVSVDKYDAEKINLMKVDLLGLKTMGMIAQALPIAGMTLEELYRIPLDDPATIEAFHRNDVIGVFQFEGRATRLVGRDLQPDNFLELVDVNALSRPGPLFSGTTAEYIKVKHGEMEPTRIHPILDKITEGTKGQIIYQEQILHALSQFGGLSVKRVHEIRRIISKKLGEAQFNTSARDFAENAARMHGVSEELAMDVWGRVVTSASYAFCLTGDAKVYRGSRNQNGETAITLEELWDAYNSKTSIGSKLRYGQNGRRITLQSMCDDGRIRPRQFLKIERSEIPVLTFDTKLSNGTSFRSSSMHVVLTAKGYRKVEDLSPGDELVSCDPYQVNPRVSHPDRKHMGTTTPAERAKAYAGRGTPTGAENPSWIDGRSVALKAAKRAAIERTDGKCSHCQARQGTMHVAHILDLNACDGDYLRYHSEANVMLLCPSCHLRFDYAKGEHSKRDSKGKAAGTVTVESVTCTGKAEYVYAMHMNSSEHNYLANGVIHHNVYSHSLAYTMIGYWCMYLKVHHPVAFYTAQLRKIDKEKWPKLIRDAGEHGIRIDGTDLNKSGETWTAISKTRISAGFMQLPGVGPALTGKILEDRESNGPFNSFEAFQRVKGVGPSMMNKIRPIICGDDPFGLLKTQIALDAVKASIASGEIPLRRPTHNSDAILDAVGGQTIVWVGMAKLKEYKDAIEDERARSGDTLEVIRKRMKRPDLATNCVVHAYDDAGEDVYVRVTRFDFAKFKAGLEGLRENEDVIHVIARKSNGGFGASIYAQSIVVIDPSDDDEENG